MADGLHEINRGIGWQDSESREPDDQSQRPSNIGPDIDPHSLTRADAYRGEIIFSNGRHMLRVPNSDSPQSSPQLAQATQPSSS